MKIAGRRNSPFRASGARLSRKKKPAPSARAFQVERYFLVEVCRPQNAS
jgi:hypothetical protein